MKAPYRLLSIISCLTFIYTCYCDEELKVCGPQMGCVRGKYMPGYDTEKFEAFLGIPFAFPPVKILRFADPVPMTRFIGVYDATQVKSDCIQLDNNPNIRRHGSEDCLYINVYRPVRSDPQKLLPVMVYIYGGGFQTGTGSPLTHGPEYFMDTKEVILVVFNYRLNVFGFISTNDNHMSGNQGLKDQNLALRWVQKNIESFGGNLNMVTIFGQSAGGISAHLQMLSKQSEGLFHRMIALSGTANMIGSQDDPLIKVRTLAKLCNISNSETLSTKELKNALRGVEAFELLEAANKFGSPFTFYYVVESSNSKNAFMTEDPIVVIKKGNYKAVPWMASFVKDEGAIVGSMMENENLKEQYNKYFDVLLQNRLQLPEQLSPTQKNKFMSSVIDKYFDGKHQLTDDNDRGLSELSTAQFHVPLYNAIYSYVNSTLLSNYPIYVLNFDYKGNHSYVDFSTGGKTIGNYGVTHCDDLIYLFRQRTLLPDPHKDSTDAKVMRSLVDSFVYFAKYGRPRNGEMQRTCNSESFKQNGFCDYQQFKNAGENSFEIRTSNSFNIDAVNFWNNFSNV